MAGCIISSRARNFILGRFAPPHNSSEIPHTTVFVFGIKVLSILIESKGQGILTRSWLIDLFLILIFDFGCHGKIDGGASPFDAVVARSWVFIADGTH